MASVSASLAGFDPAVWLATFASLGGGYALMSGGRLAFLVGECAAGELTDIMAQIVGQPDRQEAIKSTIERRSLGEIA